MQSPTDDVEQRTSDFMHALAANERIDAANISADSTGAGMMVHAWIPPEDVDALGPLASDFGFTVYGETQTELKATYNRAASAGGRERIRFETTEDTDE